MKHLIKIVLGLNLIVLTSLVFIYPDLMVSSGKLSQGHDKLAKDCFACHSPLLGADFERCMTCHKLADIGRLTTTGQALTKTRINKPFHQKLISQDCMACHVEHAGAKRYRAQRKFDHALLQVVARAQCQSCHQAPADVIHKQAGDNCAQCHTQTQWTPATFDHNKYFVLDNNHKTECIKCHLNKEFKRYTCYGCHEHTPENMQSVHREEGVQNINDCVKCHRSASDKSEGNEGSKDGRRNGDD